MDSIPSTSLHWHAKKSQYILQRWYRPPDSGVCETWGEFVYLTEDDVRKKGLDIILVDLAGFDSRHKSVHSEFTGSPERKKRASKLLREADKVSISLHFGDELWISPIVTDGRGRGTGFEEDLLFLSLPSTNEKFFAILKEAYDKCCRVYR